MGLLLHRSALGKEWKITIQEYLKKFLISLASESLWNAIHMFSAVTYIFLLGDHEQLTSFLCLGLKSRNMILDAFEKYLQIN